MRSSLAYGSPAWTAAGWTMVHSLWIGAAIGLAGATLRRLLRSARPEVRYGASLACLAAMTAAPAAVFLRVYEPVGSPRPPAAPAPATAVATAGHTTLATLRPPPILRAPSLPTAAPVVVRRSRLESLVAWLPAVWIAGSSATLATLGLGLVGLRRMRRSSCVLSDGDIPRRARLLAESLGIARGFRIAVCDRLTSPVLMGILRPMILLPPSAVTGWGMDHLEMALLHELAHLRRHDNLVNLLQCAAESLLFFHPAAWWLSAWVRLERESCCDRLVVERTGRSHAYAEMLASLATSRGKFSTASAMAERPVTTRIRRILNGEDRPMRLTVPEGFGLISAALAAATLALGAHAAPAGRGSEATSDEARRTMLREVAEKVSAVRFPAGGDLRRSDALIDIASAQMAIGDRESAEATIRKVEGATAEDAGRAWIPNALATMLIQTQVSEAWRKAGDLDSARAALIKAEAGMPNLDDPTARFLFQAAVKAMVLIQGEAADEVVGAVPLYVTEMLAEMIEARLALGDLEEAREHCLRAVAIVRPSSFSQKPVVLAALGGYLVKAGDREGGLALIVEGRIAALASPEKDRDGMMPHVVRALAEAGEVDAATALSKSFGPGARRIVAREILESVSTDDKESGFPWLDPSGIKILIGACGTMPRDPTSARKELPEIARRIRELGDITTQARALSSIAELQAMSGDLAGATATARSIPELRRGVVDPKDGFYDAVKPGTMAKVAVARAKGGDAAGAAELFREAASLSRLIDAEDQKMIAQIVLSESHLSAGDRAKALAIVREAVPLTKPQPEPRRSRGLAMLACVQARAGDADGATATSDLIRDYPGLEKARALGAVAGAYEASGDAKAAIEAHRRAMALLEAAPPKDAKLGEVLKVRGFAKFTFVDYDLEFDPAMIKFQRQQAATALALARPGGAEPNRVGPGRAGSQDLALSARVSQDVRQGNFDDAMKAAEAIENPGQKLSAYQSLAIAVRDGRKAK